MHRLVPFDSCSCLREIQSKYAISSICQARLTTVNGTRVPGGPGSGPLKSGVTRWRVRVQPPEFGGYPFVAGTRRVAPLHYSTASNVRADPSSLTNTSFVFVCRPLDFGCNLYDELMYLANTYADFTSIFLV